VRPPNIPVFEIRSAALRFGHTLFRREGREQTTCNGTIEYPPPPRSNMPAPFGNQNTLFSQLCWFC
jgi:hypothetical protein